MLRCNRKPNAKAIIKGSEKYPGIVGKVLFFQEKDTVLVHTEIIGLPHNETGFFGFHIHEGTDCKDTGFPNTKGHLNPENLPHPLHMGDLPPLLSCNGNASTTVRTCRFRVKEIIGRTVVIHYGTDDFRTDGTQSPDRYAAAGYR